MSTKVRGWPWYQTIEITEHYSYDYSRLEYFIKPNVSMYKMDSLVSVTTYEVFNIPIKADVSYEWRKLSQNRI